MTLHGLLLGGPPTPLSLVTIRSPSVASREDVFTWATTLERDRRILGLKIVRLRGVWQGVAQVLSAESNHG